MKKIFLPILTILITLGVNVLASSSFNIKFLELTFVSSLLITVVIYFFSSEGGLSSRALDAPIKRFMNKDTRDNGYFTQFHNNTSFITSLTFTIISAIATIIYYWEYF